MKKYLLFLAVFVTSSLLARVSSDRIKGWLELDDIQKNLKFMIHKYDELDLQLKKETNEVLQRGVEGADEIAQSDPYAALVMYHKIKKLKDVSACRSLEIASANQKFQELSNYVDRQYKELHEIRLKHLRFPF